MPSAACSTSYADRHPDHQLPLLSHRHPPKLVDLFRPSLTNRVPCSFDGVLGQNGTRCLNVSHHASDALAKHNIPRADQRRHLRLGHRYGRLNDHAGPEHSAAGLLRRCADHHPDHRRRLPGLCPFAPPPAARPRTRAPTHGGGPGPAGAQGRVRAGWRRLPRAAGEAHPMPLQTQTCVMTPKVVAPCSRRRCNGRFLH